MRITSQDHRKFEYNGWLLPAVLRLRSALSQIDAAGSGLMASGDQRGLAGGLLNHGTSLVTVQSASGVGEACSFDCLAEKLGSAFVGLVSVQRTDFQRNHR